jgi:predicted phage terminase large subunit-like protein
VDGGGVVPCSINEGENWHLVDEKPEGFGHFARGWDLASSSTQTVKHDPDWTVGVKAAIKKTRLEIPDGMGKIVRTTQIDIYIDDIVRIRKEATARNDVILRTAVSDEAGVVQVIEAVGAYKDAYTTLKSILKGARVVKKSDLSGDKVTKATNHLSQPFDNGKVFINRAIPKETREAFLKTIRLFPSFSHDDDVDALVVTVHELMAIRQQQSMKWR